MSYNHKKTGFTIVELLIVVVVIAILAAITIVAYNGIQQRAVASSLQSELSQAVKKLESMKITSGTETYPASLTAAGIPDSKSGSLQYFYQLADNSYCVQIVKGSVSYTATSAAKNPILGACTGSSLVGWWRMNGDTLDSSGSGNNGVGSVITSVEGENARPNGAYSFSYLQNSSITVPSSDSLNTNAQTFSIWIKPTSAWTTSPTASVLMSKRDGTSGFFMAYVAAVNALVFDCGGTSQRWNSNTVPKLDEWSLITFTCSLDGQVNFYQNGIYVGGRTGANRANISTTAPLRIGRESNDSLQYNFNGNIDDARIYNRVLSEPEVKALYDAHAQ